uniref:Putative secreted protein n=1 Tax=Amblyomma triste TaxID=251400 RepID=A0A023G055_AMBTT
MAVMGRCTAGGHVLRIWLAFSLLVITSGRLAVHFWPWWYTGTAMKKKKLCFGWCRFHKQVRDCARDDTGSTGERHSVAYLVPFAKAMLPS